MNKNVAITILLIIVLCLGGYLVFDKSLYRNNNLTENPISKNSSDLDTSIARKFIDELINLNVFNILNKLSESGLTEENKLSMAISKTYKSYAYFCKDIFEMNEASTNEYRGSDKKWGCVMNEKIPSCAYDLVNEQYKKLFGSSKNVDKIETYAIPAYEYSEKIDSYVELSPRFGPIISNKYYYSIESAKINDNKLNIEITYLSYMPANLSSDTEFRYTLDGSTYNTFNKDEISKVFNDNKKSLSHLTFNYEKEKENYVLKSIN